MTKKERKTLGSAARELSYYAHAFVADTPEVRQWQLKLLRLAKELRVIARNAKFRDSTEEKA